MKAQIATSFLSEKEINSLTENHKANDNDPDKTIQNGLLNSSSQVKVMQPKNVRRKFKNTDRLRILEAFDACQNSLARGALLRKEGLYYSTITKWRKILNENKVEKTLSRAPKWVLMHQQIARENAALKKKLAQAEAIIDLQKKVSELLSLHVLKAEVSEMPSW